MSYANGQVGKMTFIINIDRIDYLKFWRMYSPNPIIHVAISTVPKKPVAESFSFQL